LDPNVRCNFLRSLASRLEGVSRPSNRQIDGALCAALAQYGVAAGRGVLVEARRVRKMRHRDLPQPPRCEPVSTRARAGKRSRLAQQLASVIVQRSDSHGLLP
jgi:hypothetical protein